ncbi:tRNA1(Val) (adenine(37)-N6)-methyltransferase [Plastorhodobacter daqingensis]|uniref:tRNA1(Val) (Adenine(37)-N6)-methyltransferase n=1 Tax=Plastorhodobacter daqingensis TaxID=1387281 RepID=A0ABW2UHY4_9RHOB
MTSSPPEELFPSEDLTLDAFLGGRVRAFQPRRGYRAAMDPVLLAAAVPARPGQELLELGCGAGVASLCLASRVPGLSLTGVERQPAYADLARRNAAENGAPLTVVCADLQMLPSDLRDRSFDHVLANPPYYPAAAGTPARDAGREAALREETPLKLWTSCALRRLRPRGWLTMIQAADRLSDLLVALDGAGSVTVLPIAPRLGRAAGRVIVQVRKQGRSPLRLLAPLVLHRGSRHEGDGEAHSPAAQAILREGAPLDLQVRAETRP